MNYLLAEHLTKSYGEKLLFEDISFGIDKGQKLALIAKNGEGKSTLLNILAGKDFPDTGKLTIHKDIKLSYLPQDVESNNKNTVIETLFNSDNEYIRAIRDYNKCLNSIKQQNKLSADKELEEAISRMDLLKAWDYKNRVKEILHKFEINNLNQQYKDLSGGQKKKVALAKALIEEADLFLLDEPTNHLDIETIEWLENYLSKKKLTLLLVTHDRYFLDNVCDEIIELDNSKIYRYRGNYTYFLQRKAEREFVEEQGIEKAKNLYRKELEWIRRQPKARTSKSKAKIDAFYKLKEKTLKKSNKQNVELNFQMNRIGNKILEMNNVSKNFGEFKILDNFTYIFKKKERIGIVGKNGIGKSTSLNLITGLLKPDKGKIIKGQTIKFGYYSQQGFIPVEDKRVIDIVKDIAEQIYIGKGTISASQFLSYFNFSHSTQYNYFSNLSVGEKRRLYLLMTLIKNPNFLILDEPTNDLDILTLNILENFLIQYQGCLIIVSHDRCFMDKLVEHIFAFEGNGKIKDYPGNYTQYHKKKIKENNLLKQREKTEKPKRNHIKKLKPIKNKPSYKEKHEFIILEKEINELEKEKAQIVEKLNKGNNKIDELQKLSERFGEIKNLIETKENRWLELSELM